MSYDNGDPARHYSESAAERRRNTPKDMQDRTVIVAGSGAEMAQATAFFSACKGRRVSIGDIGEAGSRMRAGFPCSTFAAGGRHIRVRTFPDTE